MGNFGPKHLTGLLWLFSLIFFLLILLLMIKKKGNYGTKYDRKVILFASLFIWGLEVIKTIYIFRSDDFSGNGNYPAFMMPFHICSMALYAFPILASNHQKFRDFVKPFAFAVMLLMTSIILAIPASSGIMGSEPNWHFTYINILPFQSFLYHGTLVFVPLYMVLSGFYRPRISDVWKAFVVLIVVAVFAFALNKALGTTDFMTLEYGNGNPFKSLLYESYPLYILLLFSVSTGGTAVVMMIGDILATLNEKNRKLANQKTLLRT
ncbi:MAG: YwaF family protein [Candidatus Izemoplasmatales bacterium]|nr:YwaF family protein [Candidatus Izemoplasmatales bacterium]